MQKSQIHLEKNTKNSKPIRAAKHFYFTKTNRPLITESLLTHNELQTPSQQSIAGKLQMKLQLQNARLKMIIGFKLLL